MAESADAPRQVLRDENEDKENMSSFEPQLKKQKLSDHCLSIGYKLEDRLSGILCCAVCLDLPRTCYQVVWGMGSACQNVQLL